MAKFVQTRSITAENQFTDAVNLTGYFNVSLSGTWAATVTMQRSFDSGSTWLDINPNGAFTDNVEVVGFEPERNVHYRIGVKLNDYTSGTVVSRLSQ